MEFVTALLLHRTQTLQNGQKYIYILYNSVCCIHFKPLQIQLNYQNHLPLILMYTGHRVLLNHRNCLFSQPIRGTSSWQRVGFLTRSYNQILWFLYIVTAVFFFFLADVAAKKMNPQYKIPLQTIWLKLSILSHSAD